MACDPASWCPGGPGRLAVGARSGGSAGRWGAFGRAPRSLRTPVAAYLLPGGARPSGPQAELVRSARRHRDQGADRQRRWLPQPVVRGALADTGVHHQRTRPYRPQTNGKVERRNRTLLEEWAYQRLHRSNAARDRALPGWVHRYNMHRAHTALGGRPPISRINNLPGYYT